MKKTVIAALAMCALAAPAVAQEASNFSGFNVGAVVGFDSTKLAMYEDSASKSGLLYGLTVGYDYNLGGVVIGLQAEAADATTQAKDGVDGYSYTLGAGRDLYVGARVGVPVSDLLMVYAKGGYTNARLEAEYRGEGERFSDSENMSGYRAGLGIEAARNNKFARVEYRYSKYSSVADTDVDVSRHQVALVAGLRF